jgi:hypothetical protein
LIVVELLDVLLERSEFLGQSGEQRVQRLALIDVAQAIDRR